MANLFLADGSTIKAYAGFSTTLVGSINTGPTTVGVDIWPGGPGNFHVVTIGGTNQVNVIRHAPNWSSTITDFLTTGLVFSHDVAHDTAGNLMLASSLFGIFLKYVGFSTTVLTSFGSPYNSGFADDTTAGDTYGSAHSGAPQYVKLSGFTSTLISSFGFSFTTFIGGGQALANNDLMSTYLSALFGGLQLVAWHVGFSSTLVAQLSVSLVGFGGMAYFEDTFDFSIHLSGNAPVVFGADGTVEASAEREGAAAIVFGSARADIDVDACHWLSAAAPDWLTVGSGAWLSPADDSWLTSGTAAWATLADSDWVDPKECS